MTEATLRTETIDGVRSLTLHRPEVRNAINLELRRALAGALATADADPAVRVIVITGSDPAFCGGVDVKSIRSGELADPAVRAEINPAAAVRAVRKPVIAAVNGPAITGGLELALSCDVIVASERARFADTHARLSMIPAWGLTALLPQRVGVGTAKVMSLTGRVLDAGEAHRVGLADQLVEHDALLPWCHELAAEIAQVDDVVAAALLDLYDLGDGQPRDERLLAESRAVEAWSAARRP